MIDDNEYCVDILFGFATDSGDVLGKLIAAPTKANHLRVPAGTLLEAVSGLSKNGGGEYALLGLRDVRVEKVWQTIDENLADASQEIRDTWWEHIRPLYGETLDVATLCFKKGEDTSLESIVDHLGHALGIPACVL